MDQALTELIQAIKEIAPAIWDIALKQVNVQIAQNFAGAVVMLIIGITGIVLGIKYYKHYKLYQKNYRDVSDWMDDGESALWICLPGLMFGIPCLLLWVIPFMEAIVRVINPEWYAIQILLGLVK